MKWKNRNRLVSRSLVWVMLVLYFFLVNLNRKVVQVKNCVCSFSILLLHCFIKQKIVWVGGRVISTSTTEKSNSTSMFHTNTSNLKCLCKRKQSRGYINMTGKFSPITKDAACRKKDVPKIGVSLKQSWSPVFFPNF